ncbi:hypothetical protein R3I93_018253 [Phoxinus phoxinus]|uniref:Uncharacterized protein n=1 Tax=Phoxinus phoxinus TaxID=58324 RepID=A0AAN9CGT4_9TELE
MKTMIAVNSMHLFILVWTLTAVCQADDAISVSCEAVTGTVREKVPFTCSVSLKESGCCIRFYKFQYPEKYNDSEICREVPPDSCEQINSFTCRFSSTTAMTEQFRFFVQATCGAPKTEFTVNITETSKPEPVTKAPDSNTKKGTEEGPVRVVGSGTDDDFGSRNTVVTAVMGCFIFIIIIIVTIIYKKKPNYSKPCGFQRIFLGHKHDDNNSNFQEQNPESV